MRFRRQSQSKLKQKRLTSTVSGFLPSRAAFGPHARSNRLYKSNRTQQTNLIRQNIVKEGG